jgi:hypothetical protein
LNRNTPPSRLAAFLSLFMLLLTASCAVPLAPGYRIVKMSRSIHFMPGSPAALQVEAHYTLENFGTADLDFMNVDLPDERLYGRSGLHIVVDGKDVMPIRQTPESTQEIVDSERIVFPAAWPRHARLELTIAYAFRTPTDPGSRITIGDKDFHLSARGWYPVLRAPAHMLSSTPSQPPHMAIPCGCRVTLRCWREGGA